MNKVKQEIIDLANYFHNREESFKKISDDLRDLIDKFANQEQLLPLFNYFLSRYGLPESVVKQKIKKRIANAYLYKKALFSRELSQKMVLISFLKYLGVLFYSLFYSQKAEKIRHYKLIIDGIASRLELLRFKKLIDLFGGKDVLVVTSDKEV
ncbi:MAG: hypothetical protein PHE97_07780, partial [Candidatus Omnitrophica bacterium]|nr:hypothetical protein [Candidatus Omnitrophota bacterium]